MSIVSWEDKTQSDMNWNQTQKLLTHSSSYSENHITEKTKSREDDKERVLHWTTNRKNNTIGKFQ